MPQPSPNKEKTREEKLREEFSKHIKTHGEKFGEIREEIVAEFWLLHRQAELEEILGEIEELDYSNYIDHKEVKWYGLDGEEGYDQAIKDTKAIISNKIQKK